jgi:hypothetical protein
VRVILEDMVQMITSKFSIMWRVLTAIVSNVFFWVGICLLGASAIIALIGHHSQYGRFWWSRLFLDLYPNISTGFFEIAITVLAVDGITRSRAAHQEKRSLVLQVGSPDNAHAIEAVRRLRARGWISTALKKAYLSEANLEEANLQGANLQHAILTKANMKRANFFAADLEGASLIEANLIDADLPKAILRSCNLFNADLRGAILGGADLSGANLKGANLKSAKLGQAKFNQDTILPDGNRWADSTLLDRYVDG